MVDGGRGGGGGAEVIEVAGSASRQGQGGNDGRGSVAMDSEEQMTVAASAIAASVL